MNYDKNPLAMQNIIANNTTNNLLQAYVWHDIIGS
jgi:hypothetical protein